MLPTSLRFRESKLYGTFIISFCCCGCSCFFFSFCRFLNLRSFPPSFCISIWFILSVEHFLVVRRILSLSMRISPSPPSLSFSSNLSNIHAPSHSQSLMLRIRFHSDAKRILFSLLSLALLPMPNSSCNVITYDIRQHFIFNTYQKSCSSVAP